MANEEKAMPEQEGLENHREISNTAGHLAKEDDDTERRPMRADDGEVGPRKAGLKTGDDEWHNRANRRSEKGEGSEPMGGGNTAR